MRTPRTSQLPDKVPSLPRLQVAPPDDSSMLVVACHVPGFPRLPVGDELFFKVVFWVQNMALALHMLLKRSFLVDYSFLPQRQQGQFY